jgi:hypothetical protein
MAQSVRLKAELEDDKIVVTLPGTRFKVVYEKCFEAPGLALNAAHNDHNAPITVSEFRAMAWKAATDKARELRWIVPDA